MNGFFNINTIRPVTYGMSAKDFSNAWTEISGTYVKSFSTILQKINAVISANKNSTSIPVKTNLAVLTSTNNGYYSWALGHDGMLYAPPFQAQQWIKFNPYTDQRITFGIADVTSNKWAAIAMHPNGKFYSLRYNAGNAAITLLTENLSLEKTGTFTFANLIGCSIGIDGNIYAGGNSTIYCYSPLTGRVTSFGTIASGLIHSFVPHPNGNLYGISRTAGTNTAYEINVLNRTVKSFGAYSLSANHCASLCIAGNGMIYGFPYNGTTMIKIDPYALTLENVGTVPGATVGGNNFASTNLAPNGNLYAGNYAIRNTTEFNPYTNSFRTLNTTWNGCGVGIMHPNGKMYFNNQANTGIQVLDFGYLPVQFTMDILTHPTIAKGL